MAAPYITPKQSFKATLGTYFSASIQYTGDLPMTWTAINLPDGLEIDPAIGVIRGLPTTKQKQSALIIASNAEGTSTAVVSFRVNSTPAPNVLVYAYPKVGYADVTPFKFTTNIGSTLSAYSLLWNFGDGSISNESDPSHIFYQPGDYNVVLTAYTAATSVSVSTLIKARLLINESVYFSLVPPPTYAGHVTRRPFEVSFTSSSKGPHYIDLGAQFSRSYENQNPENKWSFLRPEWRFLDLDGNPIQYVTPEETEIYANDLGEVSGSTDNYFVGVSGTAKFYFVDDIYNFDLELTDQAYTTVIATLRTSGIKSFNDGFNTDETLPGYANSLASAAIPVPVLCRVPDNVKITENGVRNFSNPRWPTAIHPVVISTNYVGSLPTSDVTDYEDTIYRKEYSFCKSIPLSGSTVAVSATFVGASATFIPTPSKFVWTDSTGYKTPGYYKGYFKINQVSALNVTLTGSVSFAIPALSSNYYNPYLWISNPEAGRFNIAKYTWNKNISAITSPNLHIAYVYGFEMPIIQDVNFEQSAMALSGFHGINSIAALPYPDIQAWALDSEMNFLYRINSFGDILCSVDINKIISDNNLGFVVDTQLSPNEIVLDKDKNIWMTLYDSVSTLKFDKYGNFITAFNPLTSINYILPPNMSLEWYGDNSYYDYSEGVNSTNNALTAVDQNYVEPTGIDVDSNNNVWVTYSSYASGLLIKYDKSGNILYTNTYPLCSCPQQVLVDKFDNVWVALSDNIYSTNNGALEKRSSTGSLSFTIKDINGINHINIDPNQNIWFTHSYSYVSCVTQTGTISYTVNTASFDGNTKPPAWFNPNQNTDDTALEGIACDHRGRVYVLNSVENKVYVIDGNTKQYLNKFQINPQGFTYITKGPFSPTIAQYNIWNKSLQAKGDWSGFRWMNKYATTLPGFSASANSKTITITGKSVPMNFVTHEEFDVFKFNEGFDLSNQMKSLAHIPSLRESTVLFDNVLGSIYGKYPFDHNDLGVETYEKIANFVENTADIDSCNIDQLYDLAQKVGMNPDDYRFTFPNEIERIINFTSINQSRVFGAKSLSQDAFKRVNSQQKYNIGNKINSLCYQVTAGIPVILRDRSINDYRLIPTGTLYTLSAYPLNALAASIGLTDTNWPSYYEFYEFVPSFDLKQTDGIIDWSNKQTTLNRNLSGSYYWLGSEQFIDKQLSYQLYKGLNLI